MTQHQFRVHTPNLLKEIADNNPSAWMLHQPLNVLRVSLAKVAARAIELNDPELNRLMLQMTLYSAADPGSPDYDPECVAGLTEVR